MVSNKNNKRRVFLNSLFITSGSIIEKIFFFLITVLIARYLSLENYGEYATSLGLATFYSLFSNLNINISTIRSISQNHHFSNEYYTSFIFIKILLSIIAYFLLFIILQVTNYNYNIVKLTLILGVVRIFSEFISSNYALYEIKDKFKIISIFITLFSASLFAGTYVVIILKGDYFQIVWIRLFVVLIFFIIVTIYAQKGFYFKINFFRIKEFINGMLPFTISFIFGAVNLNVGILLLPYLKGTDFAGIYQNAYIFIIAIAFIPANLIRVLVPFLYKFSIEKNKDKFQFSYDIYSKLFSVMSFYFLIIIFLFSEQIIYYIFGSKYNSSIEVLKIFGFSFPFIFTVAPVIILTIDKQKVNTIIDVVSAIINVIISYILIIHFGVYGAAAGFVVTYLIIYIIDNLYLSRKKIVKYGSLFLFNLKLIIITFIIILFNKYIIFDYFFVIPLFVSTLIYLTFIYLFLFEKDDLRIIKEFIFKL